jgi:hypothetical protein
VNGNVLFMVWERLMRRQAAHASSEAAGQCAFDPIVSESAEPAECEASDYAKSECEFG